MAELTKSQFATKLREVVEKKGFTGASLALKAKLSESSVSNYLAGKTAPTEKNLKALAKALGVSVDSLSPDEAGGAGAHRVLYKMESQGGTAFVKLSGAMTLEAALEIYRIVKPFLPEPA